MLVGLNLLQCHLNILYSDNGSIKIWAGRRPKVPEMQGPKSAKKVGKKKLQS